MARNRKGAVAASLAAVALLVAACSGNGNGDPTTDSTTEPTETETSEETPGAEGEEQTITWWHNATGEPLVSFWDQVGQEFAEANPGVTVNVQSFQNEELQRTLIPNALLSGDAPSL